MKVFGYFTDSLLISIADPKRQSLEFGRLGQHGDNPKQGERLMATGTVKWFNGTKGYGFIAPDEGDADIFVHISQVQQSGLNELQDNQKVSFDIEEGRNGKNQATPNSNYPFNIFTPFCFEHKISLILGIPTLKKFFDLV